MRLTYRGKVVLWLLAMATLFISMNYLNDHYRITVCRNTADGYTCQTAWKG